MEPIMQVIIEWVQTLAPAGFSAALAWIAASNKRRSVDQVRRDRARKEVDDRMSAKQDAIGNALLSLLRQHIMDAYYLHVRNGAPMTPEQFSMISSMHDAYKTLGGNGVIEHMWEALEDKEIQVNPPSAHLKKA